MNSARQYHEKGEGGRKKLIDMSFGSVPVLEIFSVLSFGENKLCQVKIKKNEKGGEFSRHGGLWHARN